MMRKYFGDTANRIGSPERADAMPAAIITAAVSSLLLVGIAIVIALVFQSKSEETQQVELVNAVSSLEVSMRSDITQASYVSPSVKLTQPSGRLLTANNVSMNGATLHIPSSNGECKIVKWSVHGTTINRDLSQYKTTSSADQAAKCNESSELVADRKKVFSKKFMLQTPFIFNNNVDRELAYTLDDITLNRVNTELEAQLTAQGVERLNDADFNELNKLVGSNSLVTGFAHANSCTMDAPKVDGVCPAEESANITSAWNSSSIATISVAFVMTGVDGETITHDFEQSTSISSK